MFKDIDVIATFNDRTGYGLHATNFFGVLQKLVGEIPNRFGKCSISLMDVVTASNAQTFPPHPSILYSVWESTEWPAVFIANLHNYDQLWVASEWARACSIAQGIPEEFVKVVPEGVNPEIYKPSSDPKPHGPFTFVHVGQWQPRKSTAEIIIAWLNAFPKDEYPLVRLQLSVDTLFPSDNFHSTEERLENMGVNDPRIQIIHFEEKDAYIKRLQSADCFISCARSEGWGLPIIEAMACGIPTIATDWSGSTEYTDPSDTILVPHKSLIKPYGIYGNWDVPGKWCEPDFEALTEKLKDVYTNHDFHKANALKSSERIRRDFSWESAARKALVHLESLHKEFNSAPVTIFPVEKIASPALTPEQKVRAFAAKRGFKIESMSQKPSAIFAVDSWPDTPDKMSCLSETIDQVHECGYPVLVTSHYPLPADVMTKADYYIYEQRDIMSGDDHPIYWRRNADGTIDSKRADVEYQGVAALNCFRNAIDFCRGRYDWIYQMSADMEVDLPAWIALVLASTAPMVCIPYEGNKDGIGGGLWAGKTEVLDSAIPRLDSWEQYANAFPDHRFVAEKWIYAFIEQNRPSIARDIDWISIPTWNRFNNLDKKLWEEFNGEDQFILHFIDGPFLEIIGSESHVYNVTWSTPSEPNIFSLSQKGGTWSRPDRKYYQDWTVTASLNGSVKFSQTINLKDRRVLISLGSKALGDTIAWIPYVEEFRKKHGCHVVCSCWWKDIFDYPEIEFVDPGTPVENIFATYEVGCFDEQLDKNKVNWRLTPLQQVASDILGLDYTPIRARLKYESPATPPIIPYICFSEFSTMQNKLWNLEGAWQKVIDHIKSKGYSCVSVSTEQTHLSNVISHNGQTIQDTIADIAGAFLYIGLNHGPFWIAYSLGIPCIMITGVSEPFNDPPGITRIQTDACRPGCFNDPSLPIERGWEWCPRKQNYICTSSITPEMVIESIDKLIPGGVSCQQK